MRSFKGEALRFVGAGVLNTGAGYLIYLAALMVMSYRVAYTVSYAIGILISYATNTSFVFRRKWSWKRLAIYPVVYALQYGIGLACLSLFVEVLGIPTALAPLLVVLVTLPITFVASRYVIKGNFT